MKKIKLFLADDHQIILDGLQALLGKEEDMEVVGTAHSGERTLQMLAETPVDVVVLDINMVPGGMDGIETARRIRRSYPNMKTVLLTMYGDGQYILNALKLGVNGYVIKEKSSEFLVGAIHAVLRGNRYFPPELLDRVDFSDAPEPEEEVQFTKREKEILCMMVQNPSFTAQDIADKLFIARVTVEKHIQNMKEKIRVHRSAELAQYGRDRGICG